MHMHMHFSLLERLKRAGVLLAKLYPLTVVYKCWYWDCTSCRTALCLPSVTSTSYSHAQCTSCTEPSHPVLTELTEACTLLPSVQARLYCGAQHLFWSSLYGSILGDDGR